jgi:protein-tyrosine phosphatase
MGISRSAAAVVAYYISHGNMSFWDAYNLVKKTRRQAQLNFGFIQQLLIWEEAHVENKDYRSTARYRLWKMARPHGLVTSHLREE